MSTPPQSAAQDDNLYQPPMTAVTGQPEDFPREQRTANGSWVKVGERRRFTGRWIAAKLIIGLIVLPAQIGVFVFLSVGLETAFPFFGSLLGIVGFLASFYLLASWYNGTSDGKSLVPTPNFDERSMFLIEMEFVRRLPATVTESRDSADDVGIPSFDGEFLDYRGDRIEMRLNRKDVLKVERLRAGADSLWLIGPKVMIELYEPLLHRSLMLFMIREGFPTTRANRRGRGMYRALQDWSLAAHTQPASAESKDG